MSPTRARTKKTKAAPTSSRPFVAHHLVPPHELLSEAEAARVIAELGTPAQRLPRIHLTDPGLKTDPGYVKAREEREKLEGRLVRIRRPSETAGTAIAYRIITGDGGE